MPMHDWNLVPEGIFHALHQSWISAFTDRLNNGLLPRDMYALPEQAAGGFTPDVLALHSDEPDDDDSTASGGGTAVQTRPKTTIMAEAHLYLRKKNHIAIRHVSGDRIVAIIEIVSPGIKSANYPLETLVRKARDFLKGRVHLLLIDPFPPGTRDPNGIHPLIWREFSPEADAFALPPETLLTLMAYEASQPVRAYVELLSVGDRLPDMPLFIGRDRHVMVPLEETYQTSFNVQPRRWREVLVPPTEE